MTTGVTANGDGEMLGVEVGDSEDKAFWLAFFRDVRARRLSGLQLVISGHYPLLGARRPTAAGWWRSATAAARQVRNHRPGRLRPLDESARSC